MADKPITFDDLSLEEKNRAKLQWINDVLAGRASDLVDPYAEAMKQRTEVNLPDLLETFRNREFSPSASGVKYIFTGGSPFPQTRGQRLGEQLAAMGGAFTNINSRAGNPAGAALGALIDMLKRRRQGGAG